MAPVTRSNPPDGSSSNRDSVAAQLATIAARLDSLLSLKDDIAVLKNLMYGTSFRCNNQSSDYDSHKSFDDFGDDKKCEEEPRDPAVTDLVRDDTSNCSGFGVVLVMEKCDLEVPDEKQAENNQRRKEEHEDLRKSTLERIRSNDKSDGAEDHGHHKLVFDGENMALIKSTDLDLKLKEQADAYGVITVVVATNKSPIRCAYGVLTVLQLEDLRHYYNNKDISHNLGSYFLRAGNKDVQADLKRRELVGYKTPLKQFRFDLRTSRFFGRVVLIRT